MSRATVPSPAQAAFLEAHRVAYLATVDNQGRPHCVPVCFALTGGRLYIAIDEKPKRAPPAELRRVRNVRVNPSVCLVVDHYDEDWSRLAWLQVRGAAALVEDADERAGALAALRTRYPQYQSMALEDRPLLRITPARLVEWRATT